MTLDLKDRVFAIVNGSENGLKVEELAEALAKDIEKIIKTALDNLSEEKRITKNRGASVYLTTYHKPSLIRRA